VGGRRHRGASLHERKADGIRRMLAVAVLSLVANISKDSEGSKARACAYLFRAYQRDLFLFFIALVRVTYSGGIARDAVDERAETVR